MVELEFQIPSVDRAAKVLPLHVFLNFIHRIGFFWKFEKVDPLPFVAKFYFLHKTYLKYLSVQM